MSVAARKSPPPTVITAPGIVLLEWNQPLKLPAKANALIRTLQAIAAYRGKVTLD